jgi:cytochrome c2
MKRCLPLIAIIIVTACKPKETVPAADPIHGKQLIGQYGCTTCHIVPGIDGTGMIGPSLEHVATRPVIAQKIPNTPQNMSGYIQNPLASNPQNEMPNLGVKPDEARDITAYLYTLK